MQMHLFNTGPADYVNHECGDVARDGQWARVGDVIHDVVLTDTHYGIRCDGVAEFLYLRDFDRVNCATCLKMAIGHLLHACSCTDDVRFPSCCQSTDDDLF